MQCFQKIVQIIFISQNLSKSKKEKIRSLQNEYSNLENEYKEKVLQDLAEMYYRFNTFFVLFGFNDGMICPFHNNSLKLVYISHEALLEW